ncbi:ImuA family protein [Caulobacter sp. NIBR2454]|uniref:ImuA family protein n=1 Tax=Caulobacter sp. NIBR2454 TaxID=3015996 RepID=UPI0022B6040E|nr:protein imuA [Caulobacter sp. NIBR2454]
MSGSRAARLSVLKGQIAALEAGTRTLSPVLSFGDPRIDGCFPQGGLPLGRWHEVAGEGLETETAACAAGFTALMVGALAAKGEVVWVMRRDDLHAPGLASLGFPVDRLIQVCVRDEAEALAALEDALGSVGVAAAVGEVEAPDLRAGRRLQLACERRGATGFVLRRKPFGGPSRGRAEPSGSASATRWRIGAAPCEPEPWGLGAPRWRVALERCRGGRSGEWLLQQKEDEDGAHPFAVVPELANHDVAAQERQRA